MNSFATKFFSITITPVVAAFFSLTIANPTKAQQETFLAQSSRTYQCIARTKKLIGDRYETTVSLEPNISGSFLQDIYSSNPYVQTRCFIPVSAGKCVKYRITNSEDWYECGKSIECSEPISLNYNTKQYFPNPPDIDWNGLSSCINSEKGGYGDIIEHKGRKYYQFSPTRLFVLQ